MHARTLTNAASKIRLSADLLDRLPLRVIGRYFDFEARTRRSVEPPDDDARSVRCAIRGGDVGRRKRRETGGNGGKILIETARALKVFHKRQQHEQA